MAKGTPKPYGVDIDLKPDALEVVVKLFARKEGDNEVLETETFAIGEIGDATIVNKLSCYGLSKILQDRTSDKSSTPDRLDFMKEVFARLTAGQWEKAREASGPTVSPEVEALARIKDVPVAAIQKSLRSYDADKRAAILAHPKVAELAQVIREEREDESEPTTLDDMLDEPQAEAASA